MHVQMFWSPLDHISNGCNSHIVEKPFNFKLLDTFRKNIGPSKPEVAIQSITMGNSSGPSGLNNGSHAVECFWSCE